jgi:hypothetical protein
VGSSVTDSRAALVAVAVAGIVGIFAACGTSAVGVQQCRQIEDARCQRASACGINLQTPVEVGNDVDACIRFYNDQCLHGLVTQTVPTSSDVSSCIQAINADCAYVLVPQSSAACSWLNPVVEVDAGEDAGDASDDGGDASDANDDGG